VLVAGVVAIAIFFQGIQAVAPCSYRSSGTREIEDRVLAPLPIGVVACEKIVAGALQCLLAGLIVFPIAAVVPATPVHLDVNWLVVLTLVPIACLMSGAVGLMFGTMFNPRSVPMLFGVIVIPITFLGCVYYSWQSGADQVVAGRDAGEPTGVHERRLSGRAHDRALHEPVGGLRRPHRRHRALRLLRYHRFQEARHDLRRVPS
jgi:ABC-2 type transport system permease protein